MMRAILFLTLFLTPLTGWSDSVSLPDTLKYRLGHDPTWSEPTLIDADWPTATPTQFPFNQWHGEAWLRFALPALTHQSELDLLISFPGDVTVFVNGEPVPRTAVLHRRNPGPPEFLLQFSRVLYRLELSAAAEPDELHQIAVHLKGFPPDGLIYTWLKPYLHLQAVDGQAELSADSIYREQALFHAILMVTICLTFAVLHLFLFLYYPSFKANLYYSGFSAAGALVTFCFEYIVAAESFRGFVLAHQLVTPLFCVYLVFALLLTYVLSYARTPGYFKVYLWFYVVFGVWSGLQPFVFYEFQGGFVVVCFFEVVRVLLLNIRYKRGLANGGGLLLAVGGVFSMLAFLYQILILNVPQAVSEWGFPDFPAALYGPLPLMLAMSMFLSRHFAQMNKDLTKRLAQVEELSALNLKQERERARLEAENERKSQEFEAARRLQLSLLPKQLPQVPGYELAVFMKTATEVGGDYYDFHLAEDRTLTIVVGDATGHGLQAGTMVTAAKSAFNAFKDEPAPERMLTLMSHALVQMHFRGMFMAMAAVKLSDHRMTLSGAGMPPLLHYRKGEVTTHSSRGLPLGTNSRFPYESRTYELEPGDMVLMMSDGLPEWFNGSLEMFGLQRMEAIMSEKGHLAPGDVIDALVKAGDQWTGDANNDDDITFVAIKRQEARDKRQVIYFHELESCLLNLAS